MKTSQGKREERYQHRISIMVLKKPSPPVLEMKYQSFVDTWQGIQIYLCLSESLFRSLIETDTDVLYLSVEVLAWCLDPNGIQTKKIF